MITHVKFVPMTPVQFLFFAYCVAQLVLVRFFPVLEISIVKNLAGILGAIAQVVRASPERPLNLQPFTGCG